MRHKYILFSSPKERELDSNIKLISYELTGNEYLEYIKDKEIYYISSFSLLSQPYFIPFKSNLYKQYPDYLISYINPSYNPNGVEIKTYAKFKGINSLFTYRNTLRTSQLEPDSIINSSNEGLEPIEVNSSIYMDKPITIDINFNTINTFRENKEHKSNPLKVYNPYLYSLINSFIEQEQDCKLEIDSIEYKEYQLIQELLYNRSLSIIDKRLDKPIRKNGLYYEFGKTSLYKTIAIEVLNITSKAKVFDNNIILYSEIEYKTKDDTYPRRWNTYLGDYFFLIEPHDPIYNSYLNKS
jgi:hypothetical protein